MADKITIGYFLEDIAQERFMKALVQRVAVEIGIPADTLEHDVRNATGGVSIRELKRFLRDYARRNEDAFDIVIAAIDGNCTGYQQKKGQILRAKDSVGYNGLVVCAIPDPHVEKWYLADLAACQRVIGSPGLPQCPAYKCEKNRYKRALLEAIRSSGVIPLLGGAEFGPEIVELMDLYRARQADTSLGHFIDDLRDALGQFLG